MHLPDELHAAVAEALNLEMATLSVTINALSQFGDCRKSEIYAALNNRWNECEKALNLIHDYNR